VKLETTATGRVAHQLRLRQLLGRQLLAAGASRRSATATVSRLRAGAIAVRTTSATTAASTPTLARRPKPRVLRCALLTQSAAGTSCRTCRCTTCPTHAHLSHRRSRPRFLGTGSWRIVAVGLRLADTTRSSVTPATRRPHQGHRARQALHPAPLLLHHRHHHRGRHHHRRGHRQASTRGSRRRCCRGRKEGTTTSRCSCTAGRSWRRATRSQT
jgi:hypothetical protein